ncbi:dATP/dGTP diphosphohydrolase domain-containing protein [Micromonospora sp. NBC_01813]|uniref:dATP/dGTP diphosphohydrolase domain-containing protein n=1 Tax=Micromonospora sp. NBC_01813 TaxID=2975988 RepID=UPI002DD914EE|nr:dATP/dGTP diphosphohydrolase domain-containing protein [Micromonospora sp. NBC_01813]WSA11504.1 DUF5664 domain-containing protein [Micromonospora sp. NBC_01813]
MTTYATKDSGVREQYGSGMVRDTQEGKPRFDLILVEGLPYDEQMLTRLAALMTRGAEKYGDRNWEKAQGPDELARAKASAFRHLVQWMCGEEDEDHAAATVFNLMLGELVKYQQFHAAPSDWLTPAEGGHRVDRTAVSTTPWFN